MTEVFIRTPTGWAPLGDGGNGDGPLTASETWDLHWKGAWRNNVTYIEDDVVSHAGEYWIAPEDLDAENLLRVLPVCRWKLPIILGQSNGPLRRSVIHLRLIPNLGQLLNFQSGIRRVGHISISMFKPVER